MRLLLDTHVLLWWLTNDPKLSDAAREALANPEASVFVSPASVWEIAIKQKLGRLDAPSDLEDQLRRHRFEALPITIGHAYSAGSLDRHHDDPFDRMLVAQAAAEGLTLVTRDTRFAAYGIQTLPA
ncbi:MAG TPA: type II toxin-antitoxin system VapC family toxin [Dehalococcoidia bacterium]|nr:type II toxin-antitoxin system VapC family toxin [Dehalococcoidia bacterium]